MKNQTSFEQASTYFLTSELFESCLDKVCERFPGVPKRTIKTLIIFERTIIDDAVRKLAASRETN